MSYNNLYNTPNYNCSSEAKIINNYNNNNYNNNYNNNKELIKVDTSDDYNIIVTLNDFNKIYDFFVVNCNDIYLPILSNNLFIGFTLKILNASNKMLNIYSQDNQLIYSNFYLPKGGMNIMLKSNSLFVVCAIKKDDLFSWIMV